MSRRTDLWQYAPMETATLQDIAAIIKAAKDRRDYLLWLADKLQDERAGHDATIRKEAAEALRQLVGA